MLAEIYIENFALIEKLNIRFYPGLNVITGQTGAGKSLLTDAVGMLLGGKSDKEMIRQGAGKALVKGVFSGPFSDGVKAFCKSHDIAGDILVVTREMTTAGKNSVRLNDRKITLGLLEELSPLMMNIHSQLEHFVLFQEEEQLLLLDRFGGSKIAAVKEEVKEKYDLWQERKRTLNDLKSKIADKEKRLDYLSYQKKEIENYHLQAGEDEALKEEIALLASSAERYDNANRAYSLLNGDENGGVVDGVFQSMNIVDKIAAKDGEMASLAAALNDIYYSLSDAAEALCAYRDGIDVNPARLDEAELRLSDIRRAEKKYHGGIDHILANLEEIKSEIAGYEDADYYLEKAQKAEKTAFAAFYEAAEELTALRVETGKRLSVAIETQLREMMLPDARFGVVLREAPLSAEGKDGMVFMATMNKGEPLRPLAKVASGGEISRVLLAAKIILGKLDAVQTMIFDEIDSGLGGETATRVGEKLKLLAGDMQVFAVTHSPLVAVFADHHYFIEKREQKERVVVHLEQIKGENRRYEIARMLSGDSNSEVSLRQADALFAAIE